MNRRNLIENNFLTADMKRGKRNTSIKAVNELIRIFEEEYVKQHPANLCVAKKWSLPVLKHMRKFAYITTFLLYVIGLSPIILDYDGECKIFCVNKND